MKGKPVTSCIGARAVGQFPKTAGSGSFGKEDDFVTEITRVKVMGGD